MGKKPIVSVTYEHEKISIKKQLTLHKLCVTSLLCGSWFTLDVKKIQTTKLSILLRFYFHGVLEQLKTNLQTNFRFKRVLGFAIEYA